ncbi:metallophosphoesterase [Acerihabitans sp.]|uniref:metallophosphoesterase n=1 Tax=Acerihabitans sp. TaxID=2811394 RepID=UPI002ED8C185
MKIIQLTDCHLCSTSDATLHGYNTYNGLTAVIDFIIGKHDVGCEALIVTGDISDDGSLASYRLALQQMKRLNLPIYAFGGNHDNPVNLAEIFDADKSVGNIDDLAGDDWRFIYVDTVLENQDSGLLSAAAKQSLTNRILACGGHNIALLMHHHPVAAGIPLVDDCMLLNGGEMTEICQRYADVKALCCGHAHTDYSERQNNCLISLCPATSFQWQSGARTILTQDKRGFKVLDFSETFTSTTFFI